MVADSTATTTATPEYSMMNENGYPHDWQVLVLLAVGWSFVIFGPCLWRYWKHYRPRVKYKPVVEPSLKGTAAWRRLPSEFLHAPERTFENFCSPPGLRKSPSEYPLTMQKCYRSVRKDLYRHIRDTVLHGVFRFTVGVGLVAIMVSFWIRFAPAIHAKVSYSFFERDTVLSNFGACQQVHVIITPLACFMLALYINQRLTHFYQVMDLIHEVQGCMNDLAIFIGGSLPDHEDEEVKQVLWTIYRYLNLFHLYTYQPLSKRFANLTSEDLLSAGLLFPEEVDQLQHTQHPKDTVLCWLCNMLMQLVEERIIDSYGSVTLLEALKKLRRASSILAREVRRKPPISFAQLIQLMVDGTNLLTPPALAYNFKSDLDTLSVYVWPALGSMIICIFYQGSLKLISAMEEPFGSDADDLNIDAILMGAESKVFGYLVGSNIRAPGLFRVDHFGDADQVEDEVDPHRLNGCDADSEFEDEHFVETSEAHPQLPLTSDRPWNSMMAVGSGAIMEDESEAKPWQKTQEKGAWDSHARANGSAPTHPWQLGPDEAPRGTLAGGSPGATGSGSTLPAEALPAHAEELIGLLRELGELPEPAPAALSEATFARFAEITERQTERLKRLLLEAMPARREPPAWGQSQKVVMDLLARLHEESRAGAQLRAQLAAVTSGAAQDTGLGPAAGATRSALSPREAYAPTGTSGIGAPAGATASAPPGPLLDPSQLQLAVRQEGPGPPRGRASTPEGPGPPRRSSPRASGGLEPQRRRGYTADGTTK